MSMCSSPGEDCSRYSKLRGSLHRVNNARKAPSVLCVDELPDMRPRHVKEVWRDRIRREQRCTTPATQAGHSGLPAGLHLQHLARSHMCLLGTAKKKEHTRVLNAQTHPPSRPGY